MKVVAISWVQNTGKSTLIKNHINQDGVQYLWETARDIMSDYPWISMQDFQDLIYHRESERVVKIQQLKIRQDIRLLLVDRTSLDGHVYSMRSQDVGVIQNIKPAIYNPKLYDSVIYLKKSIWPYKSDKFKHYEGQEFADMLEKYITRSYTTTVFNNYLENQKEIDEFILWISR